jgi:hypothetical protein
MLHASVRRLLAGAGVAGALVAASAAPAFAAPGDVRLAVYPFDTTVAAGVTTGTEFDPAFFASADITIEDPAITYDLSGAKGVVTAVLDEDSDCAKKDADTVVCAREWPIEFSAGMSGDPLEFSIRAAEGAEPGASGTVRVTLTGRDIEPVTGTAKVRVGEGVDLTAGRNTTAKAAPGDAFTATGTVRNSGPKTVAGLAVLFDNDRSFVAATKFSNCMYAGSSVRACTFDQELPAGASYRLAVPYTLGADTLAPGGEYGGTQWLTAAEHEDLTDYAKDTGWDLGEPGDGGVLKLERVATQRAARAPQTDVNPDDNWSHIEVTVTGRNGANLAAIGDAVTGAAGDVVTATVGVVNKGPAAVDWSRSGETIAWTAVKIPAGTTAVEVPAECIPDDGSGGNWDDRGKPGRKAYHCPNAEYVLGVDAPETYDFSLRIDTVIPDAAGAVVVNGPCECSQFERDSDPSDNTARLVVNPTAGGGTGGGAGGGAGLPVTGPMGATIAGAGLLLLAGGAVGVAAVRRGRTRFVA